MRRSVGEITLRFAPRSKFGVTEQLELERNDRLYELDAADRVCPACGGELKPMQGQFETSEMIDVIEVRYELVNVQRQKYNCKCGGCIKTALGPERATPGSRYSLDFAVNSYLKAFDQPLGLLITFNVALLKNGIRRVVNSPR